MNLPPEDAALVELGRALQAAGYEFITITPESHARVNARPDPLRPAGLRDVFGWSRWFAEGAVPAPYVDLLARANALDRGPRGLRSRVRFSTLGGRLHVHSAFPTVAEDAVFFGPDTYRFAAFIQTQARPAARVVDIGCGSGAGGLCLADRCKAIVLADINPRAVRWARVNATLAGLAAQASAVESDLFGAITGAVDLVISNPPYLIDSSARTYRHGGPGGFELSTRILEESLGRLSPGGQLLLYTGAPVRDGVDLFLASILPRLKVARCVFTYRELDPDVFGEELSREAYADIDRLCVVGLDVRLP